MNYYLITTDHLSSGIWFKDEEDFKAAMNVIPVLAAMAGVNVLAFILMSNHVHFVVGGTHEKALKFITEFKRHCSRYLYFKYGSCKTLKRNQVDIKELSLNDEGLEKAIAYVQMNSVAAGICLSPAEYPWGTGSAFFKVSGVKGVPVESMKGRARYRQLHTKKRVPPGLLLGQDGYILPESYVNTAFVEAIYRRPGRMGYFLNNSSKAKNRLESGEKDIPVFRDQLLLPFVRDICRALYNKSSVKDLKPAQQAEVLRQMRFRCSSNINQMVRVTGIRYEDVVRLLEGL